LKASVNLKIISGYDNWVNMLQDAVLRLRDIEDGDNPELSDKETCLPDRQVYTRALSDLKRLNSYLLPFEKAMTIKEFYYNLNNLIFSLNLPSNLINDRSDSIEENIKGLTVFLELMKEIFELFEIEFGKTKKFPLGFFLTNLKTAVSTSRFNIKEKPGYGVQITTLEEIRGLKFDYLFISGLCDGDLPTRYSPEIFFSGSYRKNENNHQTEERYRFYQSLCTWDRHLYLTYPLREEKKELVESIFLTEFSNLINSKIKYEKNYSDTVYSKEELMIHLGHTKCKNLPEELERDLEIDLEHIKKSISINEQRIMLPFGESQYTGYIKNELSESIKNELSDFKFKEYSISQLETYAKCPYKYMAERILKLEPVKEPTEEIEALEMGSILHKILFKFYETIKSKGIILAEANEKQIDYAENLIFEIGEKMLEEANFKSPLTFYEKEKILGINGNRQNSVLYMFLEAEIKNMDGYVPQFFEINFGRAGGDRKVTENAGDTTAPTQIMIDTISVVGKIDRIDIDKEGQKFKVIDYKLSGNKPTAADIRGGISLQLPLYLFAAKELIKAQLALQTGRRAAEPVPTGAEIYSLKFNDAEFGKQLVKLLRSSSKITEEQLSASYEEMIKICLDAVKKYVNAIIEGKFNLSMLQDRENKICRYCGFRSICRIQEVS
jgi:ATP-dependent helicase/nuclease subunit B